MAKRTKKTEAVPEGSGILSPLEEKQEKTKKSGASGKPAAAKKTGKTKGRKTVPSVSGVSASGSKRKKVSSSADWPSAAGGKSLVIVESPTKAKTLTKILGSAYVVKSSIGHIRDLPKSRLAIDVDRDFEPEYILVKGKANVKNELLGLARGATRVLLASDPDREGEAIAWHLSEMLGIDPESPCRVRFYEITADAVKEAVRSPERVDMDKVEAQQARRILDRLVGYTLSPLLWKKIGRGLSAGRVQSVALALVCDREEEIESFVPRGYWIITVTAAAEDGRKYVLRADSFDGKSLWKEGKSLLLDSEEFVETILAELKSAPLTVADFRTRESLRAAPAPFRTSTLQQEAARRTGMSPRRTMRTAQELFEGVNLPGRGPVGLITYMRTDSLRIAPEALEKCRAFIAGRYGPEYLPKKENVHAAKGRSQEAHEAIRPTDVEITPESVEGILSPDQMKIYSLIWRRFAASQMTPARVANATLKARAGKAGFRQLGETLIFPGWSAVWPLDLKGDQLEPAEEGEVLSVEDVNREEKFTKPPARYSEATLIKVLEEKGVGRPSTYASIVETLYDRRYVLGNEERRIQPTPLGRTVDRFLKKYFHGESLSSIVDTGFTARMEENLDDVEEGKATRLAVLREFWDAFTGTMKEAEKAPAEPPVPPEPIGEDCPLCGSPLVRKMGRFGEFVGCSTYPECKHTQPLLVKTGAICPKCGEGDVVKRKSRKGKVFYGCSRYPACDFVSWNPPSGKACPECGAAMMSTGKKGGEECPKCGYAVTSAPEENDG